MEKAVIVWLFIVATIILLNLPIDTEASTSTKRRPDVRAKNAPGG